MRTRASIMKQKKIDYNYEATRPMCEGCMGVGDDEICTIYYPIPGMYVRADECPSNPRKRPPITSKVRVGQGKGRSGGNL